MAGYSRQSVADIITGAVIKAAPVNAEFNQILAAFDESTGHKHDGTATEGALIPLISTTNGYTKVATDNSNDRVGVFVNVSSAAVEQVRFEDGSIVPVTDDDIDLGASGQEFKDLYIDGTANIDSLVADTADVNGGNIDGTIIGATTPAAGTFAGLTVSTGAASLGSNVDINGGTVDGASIGSNSPSTIVGTTITANTGFTGDVTGDVTGNLTGNVTGNVTGDVTGDLTGDVTGNVTGDLTGDVTGDVTGNVTGNLTGDVTGDVTGNLTGNVTANTGTSTFNNVTINGTVDFTDTRLTNIAEPTQADDAATKNYVDTEVSNLVDSAPGALDTLNELAAALGDDANFSTTVTTSIATKLPKDGSEAMTGDLDLGTNQINNVVDPSLDQDAATKKYVDDADDLKLDLAGGTMTGAIAMGTSKITGLGDPTNDQDAATKVYVDDADDLKLNLSGGTLSGNLVMGSNKVTSTATPSADDDLTRKGYVDGILGSATAAATSAGEAADSAADAEKLAINPEDSQFTLADGVTTGFSALHYAAKSEGFKDDAETAQTSAESALDSFESIYLGAQSSQPTEDLNGDALEEGDLYFDTTANEFRVYDGNSWVAAGSAVNGTSARETYTATASQTDFDVEYDVGSPSFVDVYLNGVKLLQGTDFTATSGTDIVLSTGATAGDIVDIVAYGAFSVANTYTKAEADAKFAQVSNNLSDLASASTARTNLGLGTASTNNTGDFAQVSNNLSDLADTPTALTNLGLTATAAELNTLDGYTGAVADLNRLDVTTEGTSEASKVVTADGSGDVNVAGTFNANHITENVSVITGNTTATAGELYVLNGATITLTLPATPSVGDVVGVTDPSGNTDNVVARNGENIMGSATDLTLDTAYFREKLVYSGATLGWVFY